MKRPHLYFKNPVEGVQSYHAPPRAVMDVSEDDSPKNYDRMKESFASSLSNWFEQKRIRDELRTLALPSTIDYVVFEFFDYFDSTNFENHYRTHFGLVPIRYESFNSVGYFAVNDEALFRNFVTNLRTFIKVEHPEESDEYDPDIKYIKSFTFHSAQRIKRYREQNNIVILDLFDSIDLYQTRVMPLIRSLRAYLSDKDVQFRADSLSRTFEISNSSPNIIEEIINNFDIVHTARSPLAGLVRPSAFNVPIRDFGFQVSGPYADLPIIGIIDTGISDQTPLAPLIVNSDNSFDITASGARIDNADHGTGVAALASLGKRLYPDHIGRFNADARLLSIKVLDSLEGQVSESAVLNLIRRAHQELGVGIFVLSVGYKEPLSDNANMSYYAQALDSLSNELNILILIAAGNVNTVVQYAYPGLTGQIRPYPTHFVSPDFNLCSPSDSLNSISCGAISDNMEPFDSARAYSYDKQYPGSYTRKSNLTRKRTPALSRRISSQLLKPDCACSAGDYDSQIGVDSTGLKVLSSEEGKFFERSVGTSYAAPLVANLAARLIRMYPALSNDMQTVKALILNSTSEPSVGSLFSNLNGMGLEDFIGRGIPNEDLALYSNDDVITLVLEDSISPEQIKAYPINLPQYLNQLPHSRGIIEVNATLCFKFAPVPHNHLQYCPIHMAFGLFKNVALSSQQLENDKTIQTGINGGNTGRYVFRESWSEDYYFKAKLLSNTQKLRFNIQKRDVLTEGNTFKIAVRSKFHKLLSDPQRTANNSPHPFSLVISFRERPHAQTTTGRLFGEMVLVNELEAIAELEAELEL